MRRVLGALLFVALFVTGTSCAAVQGPYGSNPPPPPSGPDGQVSVTYFYDALGDDGQWFNDPTFGWCWTPYDVSEDWRPYSSGHWEYTDYGWSWASDESFGWATFHYGRWFFDDSYGWAWVPGSEWAPAWVAWRTSDDYIGWAPLPPVAEWDASSGLAFAPADANAIPSHEWSFVPRQHLLDASLSIEVTSSARNVTLIGQSRDATRFEVRGGRPANLGFDIAEFELRLGTKVPRTRIVDADRATPDGGRQSIGGNVGYFRPRVERMPAREMAPRPAAAIPHAVIPDAVMQRQHDDRFSKLESDLTAERARLTRDHDNEIRAQAPGVAVDEMRTRQANEKQAFEAHAVQQRQVLSKRLQKQVVRPEKAAKPVKPDARPDNSGRGNDNANGRDKGGK